MRNHLQRDDVLECYGSCFHYETSIGEPWSDVMLFVVLVVVVFKNGYRYEFGKNCFFVRVLLFVFSFFASNSPVFE